MKGIRTTATVAAIWAATAALIVLTGCTASSNESDNYGYSSLDPRPSVMYVNEETGKVTKFVSYDLVWDDENEGRVEVEEVRFEEGYSPEDVEIEYPDNYPGQEPYHTVTLSSATDVEGKPYPLTTSLSFQLDYEFDLNTMLLYYNEHLATAQRVEDDSLKYFPIGMMVKEDIFGSITTALKTEGSLPAIQYQITGRTVTVADERVIGGWNAGTPAWLTLQQMQDSPVTSERYYYSFACATYDVELLNRDEVLAATANLPGADLVEFNLSTDKSTLLIETAQPCEIKPIANDGGTDKSYSNAPPAPSQGNYPPTPTPNPGS